MIDRKKDISPTIIVLCNRKIQIYNSYYINTNTEWYISAIHGLNIDEPSFFQSLVTSLSVHSDTAPIIGGDLNLVCSPEVDRRK